MPYFFDLFTTPICHSTNPVCDGIMCTMFACTFAYPINFGASANLEVTVGGVIQKVETLKNTGCGNP